MTGNPPESCSGGFQEDNHKEDDIGSESCGKGNGGGGQERSADGRDKSIADGGPQDNGDDKGGSSADGGRVRGGDDRRDSSADGMRESSVGGRGKSSGDGMGKSSADGRGESNAGGGQKSRVGGGQKSSVDGGQKSSMDGRDKRSVGGRGQRSGPVMDKSSGDDSGESSADGEQRSSGDGGHHSSADGGQKSSANGVRKNRADKGRESSANGKRKSSGKCGTVHAPDDGGERVNKQQTSMKYNANGIRSMDCSTCSWDAKGLFQSDDANYDPKDWRAILERKNDVIVSVDKKMGSVGISDHNIQSLRGLVYKADCEESYSTYIKSENRQKSDVDKCIRHIQARAVVNARARTRMNAIVSNLPLSTITRESIWSIEDKTISSYGRFEKRPTEDLCQHLFQHARDNPCSGDVYSKPNLLLAFNCIVDTKAYDRFGSENLKPGSVHDFSCKCVLMLTAINDGTIAHMSIEDSVRPLSKQGNDAIITVRGGRCYHHQDTPDINCPICIAAVQPRGEPFEFKASLVDPSKASTMASTRRKQLVARHHQDMTSDEIPVSDVRNDCKSKLSVGNMFAFAIFTVIIAPKPLIRLHGHEQCRYRGSVNHDSNQCQTCLTSYSRNLRLARVAVSSLPLAIAVACLMIQQYEE